MTKQNGGDKLVKLEAEIDMVAAQIWGINDAEMKAIRKALPDE